MTIASPPIRDSPIFNPANFLYTAKTLTYGDVSGTYAKLAGGETFAGEETFSGGIKTNSIQATSTSSYVDVKNTATSGNVTPLRILTANVTGTDTSQLLLGVEDSANKSAYIQYVPNGFTSSASYVNMGLNGSSPYLTLRNGKVGINNTTNPSYTLQVNGNGYFGQDLTINTTKGLYWGSTSGPRILGTAFESTAAATRTVTSSSLSILSSNNWCGELKVFADDGNTYSGQVTYSLAKAYTTLNVSGNALSGYGNLTTFTVAASNNTALTITTTPNCKVSYLFIGAG